jgi:cytochrome b subunit of formate dehydrogenase
MMLGTAWHLLVFGYLSYVRRTRLTMLPTLQDAKDAWGALMYNIGRAKAPPQMGRYTFEEKMEYWAFVWGAIIMGVTGFMMWNPITTTRFLPGEVIPAAKAAHGGEALLAVLAIIVWHMYGVHVKRFNRSMFTGKMTEEEMLHEHPLELADIKAGIAERPVDEATLRKRQRIYLPIAGVLALFMLLGVYGFVNAEQTSLTTVPRQDPTAEVFVPWTPTPAPTMTATPEGGAVIPTGPLTWNDTVGPMLDAKCTTCHGEGAMGGLNLSSYDCTAGWSLRSGDRPWR